MTMSAKDIDEWDERRSRELDVSLAIEAHCRRCGKVQVPTRERIEEVTTAVLHRRVQAALEELKRRRAK
jgi:uncharacterized OB-fold protein